MPSDSQRVAVLLGAGASADADLPMTNALARELLAVVRSRAPEDHPMLKLLNFIYGAMVSHRTEGGGDPFAAVNVETMISAIRLLGDRNAHEAAPFVDNWKRGVSAFSAKYEPYPDPGRALVEAMSTALGQEHPFGDDVADAVREIIAFELDPGDSSGLYRELEGALLHSTRRILINHGSVKYLRPLVQLARTQGGGLDIATLNYDLTVEHAAEQSGVEYETPHDVRLGTWGSRELHASLRLYKIHGSIDWQWRKVDSTSRSIPTSVIRQNRNSKEDFSPAIVIGDRDKLGTDGPTLALMSAFARALERAERLVVVGYAFADDHVNRLIRDWLNGSPSRTMTVLDPFWPRADTHINGFRGELNTNLLVPTGSDEAPRLRVIRATAREALERALREVPTAPARPQFRSDVRIEGTTAFVSLTNEGDDLAEVRVRIPRRGFAWSLPAGPAQPTLYVRAGGEPASDSPTGSWTVRDVGAAGSLELQLAYEELENVAATTIEVAFDDGNMVTVESYLLTPGRQELSV